MQQSVVLHLIFPINGKEIVEVIGNIVILEEDGLIDKVMTEEGSYENMLDKDHNF